MLTLPKLTELQSNLEYIKNLNHGFATRYLQGQPNASAKNEAMALQTVIAELIANKRDDLDSWSGKLKEFISSRNSGSEGLYSDEDIEQLLELVKAYADDIKRSDIDGKLNAFLTADDYKQVSDPKMKDSSGDPVQKDAEYLIRLTDDLSYFEQAYEMLYCNPALDDFVKKIAEYKDMEKNVLMQQRLLLITAPDGIDIDRIDEEVSTLEVGLTQSREDVTSLAGQERAYNEKYLAAFSKLASASEEEKKTLKEEVEFYSAEGFRSQVVDKLNRFMDIELKLSQKKRERDMFHKSFSTFNRLIDMRNEIESIDREYKEPEDFVAGKVSAKVAFFLAETEKYKAALYKNSRKFLTMQEKLKALTNAAEYSNKADELKKRLAELKTVAAEYIEEHRKDKLQLNAKMRFFRLNCASRIVAYCEKTLKSVENVPWTKTDEINSYIRHIEEYPKAEISGAEYSGRVNLQKQDIGKVLEDIDGLKLYVDSLLMTEEGQSRTGLETHDVYKKSVYRSVFYLEIIDELEKRTFDCVSEGASEDDFDIERILADIRKLLENPDKGVEKMLANPAKEWLFKPFDHVESNIMHNNYDYFDEFKLTENIKAALEAHKINTKLNEEFKIELYIDKNVLADMLKKKK